MVILGKNSWSLIAIKFAPFSYKSVLFLVLKFELIVLRLINCENPFHENWSEHEGEKIVNLRARGWVAITAFEQYVEEETSKDLSRGVKTFADLST